MVEVMFRLYASLENFCKEHHSNVSLCLSFNNALKAYISATIITGLIKKQ